VLLDNTEGRHFRWWRRRRWWRWWHDHQRVA
jgi:hypothetical protein